MSESAVQPTWSLARWRWRSNAVKTTACFSIDSALTGCRTDWRSYDAPIVSLSLGLSAKFLFGGLSRSERVRRIRLESGDVAVWGGPARLAYHGVDPLAEGNHPLTGRCRLNLTFRKALS